MTRFARIRHWLPLLPLLGLLAVTYWLNEQVQQETVKNDGKKPHIADAIMENFSALTLDEQGERRGIMAAKTLLHYPDDDSSELTQPHITSFSSNHPPVHITARHGLITKRGDEVFLQQSVLVRRIANGADQPEMRLHTEHLHFISDKDWCGTDDPVRVEQAQDILTAVGMDMDNQTQQVILRSQIKADYASPKH